LGGSLHTIKKNREAFVVVSMEIGIEINADETKYMIMSRNQDLGQSHRSKTEHSSFESVEGFKYLGTTLSNQNSIQE
jgi:hypothetical protein